MTAPTPQGGKPRRSFFEVRPGQHRPNYLRTGALFAALSAITLYVLFTRPTIPFFGSGGTQLTADVNTGINVRPRRTPVRVNGVDVGQVTDVQRAPGGRGVRITMRIDSGKGVQLKKDASLSLRWRTLLGRNLFVDLQPGSKSAPPLGDEVIPFSRTSSQVELDEVLQPLDDHGRKSVATMITEFDKGFSDPAAGTRAIDAVAPAMRAFGRGIPALRGTTTGDLTRLVTSTSRVMGAVGHDEVALGRLIDDGRTALAVTAANRLALGQTMSDAPAALAQTRSTLGRLRTTLDALDPLVDNLRPGAQKLAGTARVTRTALAVASPLLRTARPTVTDLRPAVGLLEQTARSGDTVLTGLEPTLKRTRSTFIPFLEARDPSVKMKHYETVGPAIGSAAAAFSWGDRYGPLAHFEPGAGEALIGSSPCTTRFVDPDASMDEKVKCEALAQMINAFFTGRSIKDVRLTGGPAPQAKVNKYLEKIAKIPGLPGGHR